MKNLLFVVIAIVGLSSCQQDQKSTNKEPILESEAMASRLFELFNDHKWAEMAALYGDSARFVDPSFGPDPITQSRQQIVEKYSAMAKESPDIRDSIISIYPSGKNHVIVEFISSGTTTDGISWSIPICTVFTFEGGLIVRDNTYYDIPQ